MVLTYCKLFNKFIAKITVNKNLKKLNFGNSKKIFCKRKDYFLVFICLSQ